MLKNCFSLKIEFRIFSIESVAVMKRLLPILMLLCTTAFSQNVDPIPHVPGEVLIMVDDNENISTVVEDHQFINGLRTSLASKELISKPTNIWLLEFDESAISHERLLRSLYNNKHVKLAQNNHYVHDRATVPNDPSFGSQWHHVDPQDNDIDSDSAWSITTGGYTSLGDTIVVCVIEGSGADWDHPDLLANHWTNNFEIDGNGIDDDGNGYIDDYHGWNAASGDDNIFPGGHGTQVSGMIGAVGNNNNNVTGINWTVKIMQVQRGSIGSGSNPNEANVIAAYTYPLVQRQAFNNSGGSSGALVVATNASWGIDAADPANAPLWCAFYDTLGINGILNCGATSNSNLDVDAVGDLPTACGSDYMISVTRTSSTDGQGGGYGLTTIDLGAPGINVVTTSNGGGNGPTTGTSFASPLTAGVVALLYSAQCTSLATLTKANPQQAADMVRSALLNGVDPIASLSGITVTGGRLNAANSLNEILNNCSPTTCTGPWAVAASGITNTQAEINWGGLATSYNIRYREVGSPAWIPSTTTADSIVLSGLTVCTSYEIQIQAVCSSATDTSNYSALYVFSTAGCCVEPSDVISDNIQKTSAEINWPPVGAAISYNLRYRQVLSPSWTDLAGVTSPHTLSMLDSCETYEVQVQTVCAGSVTTSFTVSDTFATLGCGACLDLTYCPSRGDDTGDEWIESVLFGSYLNTSGDDDGYAEFTDLGMVAYLDSTYIFTLTPGYSATPFSEYFRIWIDYNGNGDFSDAGEMVYDAGSASPGPKSGAISIPSTAVTGKTRMRVSMKFSSSPSECEDPFDFGEVEDYCLRIASSDDIGISNPGLVVFSLYPNPTNDQLSIVFSDNSVKRISVLNALGQTVIETNVAKSSVIDVSSLESGVYFVHVLDKSGKTGVKRMIKQ